MQINKWFIYGLLFNFLNIFSLDTSILNTGSHFENGERRLVIVVASYNNAQWYKQNLDSIFNQFYNNYRIIYIDDASNDNTAHLVENYIKEKGMEDKVLLIKNAERKFKTANIYRAFHLCDDRDIIIELDGDDWLATPFVFQVYNELYSNPKVWLTYGHFMEWPSMKPQRIREIPQGIFRLNKMRDVTACFWAGLRTYYAWLVKQIKVEDLLYEGSFLKMSSDAAIMYPLLEMAHSHAKFVGDMLLIHNVATPLNDHKVDIKMQDDTFGSIKKRPGYAQIQEPLINIKKNPIKASVFIIADHSQESLEILLKSLVKVSGIDNVFAYVQNFDKVHELRQKFSGVIFKEKPIDSSSYRSLFLDLIAVKDEYVMVLHDQMEIAQSVNLKKCIDTLEKTQCWAFLLNLSKQELNRSFFVEEDLYGMQFEYNQHILRTNSKIYGALIKSSHLRDLFNIMNKQEHDFASMNKEFIQKIVPKVFLSFEKARIKLQK